MTSYGALDMAGNVREWCWNESSVGRSFRGGAWNNNIYAFDYLSQAPAFDRSSTNGIRCVIYPEQDSIPLDAFKQVTMELHTVNYELKPVSDEVFEIYRENYSYDKINLDAEIVSIDTSNNNWIEERVIFNASYGNEQVSGHLFLPKNVTPPLSGSDLHAR